MHAERLRQSRVRGHADEQQAHDEQRALRE
jgi:hypothetical protein